MNRTACIFFFSALGFATLTACSGASYSEIPTTNQDNQQLKKKADGTATGNGSTCSTDGVTWGSTSGGASTDPNAPPDAVPGGKVEPLVYPVGATFPAPDGCNQCKCAADGIWCTVKACGGGGTGGGGKSCVVDGKVYPDGATFPSPDGCNKCSCYDGMAACTEMACVAPPPPPGVCSYDGKTYKAGEGFPSSDGCNSCSCLADGAIVCTQRACAKP